MPPTDDNTPSWINPYIPDSANSWIEDRREYIFALKSKRAYFVDRIRMIDEEIAELLRATMPPK